MATKARSRGTLNPNIPSKELTRALNAGGARMKTLKKRVLTPEILLLTFTEAKDLAGQIATKVLGRELA